MVRPQCVNYMKVRLSMGKIQGQNYKTNYLINKVLNGTDKKLR